MWARQLGEEIGVNIPNQAAEHYYLITEKVPGLTADMPVLEDPSSYGYYREEVGGLMIGLFEAECAPWKVEGIPDNFSFGDLPPDWDRMSQYLEIAMKRVPVSMDVGVRKFFCGPESFTPDLKPIVGEAPELPGYFVAAGLNSIGILTGGGMGRVVAHWIMNGTADVDVTAMNIDRLHNYQRNPEYRRKRTVESLGMVYKTHYPTHSMQTARGAKTSALHDRLVANRAYFRDVSGWEGADWYAPAGVEPKILAENIKNRRLAEVRFLRAYFYYLLVENFGNVPIVQEEISSPVTHFAPNSEQEVYDFMIAELNVALPNLEANPASTEPGRATQGAARHLLALLYLTRGYKSFGEAADFERAAQLAEELIGSSYYALLPTFAEVFQPGNELNREIIFAVQYGAQPGYNGNGQNILFGWRYWREKGFDEVTGLRDYNRRISNFMPTQFLYTLYNTTKDSRYDATFLSRFYATKTDGAIQAGDLRYYFPYPDQPFTTADSIAFKASNPNVEIIRFDKWKQAFNNVGGLEKFPMINKFYDPNAGLPYNNEFAYASTKDVFLFRLAETYLLAAEAYFKLGQLDKAAEKLNAIRQRAAKPGQNMNINAADVSIDFILDEKAREQAGEYKRWLDLKRTQRLARAFEYNILTKMANPGGLVDKYYLRPIPQSVIDRDTEGYPQNPGY
jgi:hypothetical protein